MHVAKDYYSQPQTVMVFSSIGKFFFPALIILFYTPNLILMKLEKMKFPWRTFQLAKKSSRGEMLKRYMASFSVWKCLLFWMLQLWCIFFKMAVLKLIFIVRNSTIILSQGCNSVVKNLPSKYAALKFGPCQNKNKITLVFILYEVRLLWTDKYLKESIPFPYLWLLSNLSDASLPNKYAKISKIRTL